VPFFLWFTVPVIIKNKTNKMKTGLGTLKIMTTKIHKFKNGVTLVCEMRPGTKKVAMQVRFQNGSMHETPEQNGLTFLTATSSFGGTKTRSRNDIAKQIESKGAHYDVDVTKSAIDFSAESLTGDAADVFATLSDVIRKPVFQDSEVEKVKQRTMQAFMKQMQTPSNIASLAFTRTAFQNCAAGRPVMGTQQTIPTFTSEDLQEKHKNILGRPCDIVIGFTGDIDFKTAIDLAKTHFGDLKSTSPALYNDTTKFSGGDYRLPNTLEQTNIYFGFKAPSQQNPARYAYLMMNQLLSGGMSAPLFQEIREKRGLVYGVGSHYVQMNDAGYFYIVAGTGKGNAGELMQASFDLLGDIAKNGFTEGELETARQQYLRAYQSSRETASRANNVNINNVIRYGHLTSESDLKRKLDSVTIDDVRKACFDMLSSQTYALSAVGPQATMPTEEQIKAMMAQQVEGLPAPAASSLPTSEDFNAGAQKSKTTAQKPQLAQQTRLPNGMLVISEQREGPLSCGAWVGAGSDHESAALNGATHMNEHMMFKGTPSYPAGTIDKIIEQDLHGGLNAYTSKDRTAYYFYNLDAKDLDKAVDICGEMVFEAHISDDEFDGKTETGADGTVVKRKGERDVVLEEIRRANDNPMNRLMSLVAKTSYPDQPHGRPVLAQRSL
jgi:predicted Zn-dependent peptidase